MRRKLVRRDGRAKQVIAGLHDPAGNSSKSSGIPHQLIRLQKAIVAEIMRLHDGCGGQRTGCGQPGCAWDPFGQRPFDMIHKPGGQAVDRRIRIKDQGSATRAYRATSCDPSPANGLSVRRGGWGERPQGLRRRPNPVRPLCRGKSRAGQSPEPARAGSLELCLILGDGPDQSALVLAGWFLAICSVTVMPSRTRGT